MPMGMPAVAGACRAEGTVLEVEVRRPRAATSADSKPGSGRRRRRTASRPESGASWSRRQSWAARPWRQDRQLFSWPWLTDSIRKLPRRRRRETRDPHHPGQIADPLRGVERAARRADSAPHSLSVKISEKRPSIAFGSPIEVTLPSACSHLQREVDQAALVPPRLARSTSLSSWVSAARKRSVFVRDRIELGCRRRAETITRTASAANALRVFMTSLLAARSIESAVATSGSGMGTSQDLKGFPSWSRAASRIS